MIPALVVDAVAAYRLTKLVTSDELLHRQREAIVRAAYVRAGMGDTDPTIEFGGTWTEQAIEDTVDHDAPRLATLVTCRWCAGVWISAGVVAARRVAPRAWSPVADLLACSAAAALLAGLED